MSVHWLHTEVLPWQSWFANGFCSMRHSRFPFLFVVASAVFCLAAALAGGQDPAYHFQEFRLGTYYNALQLFGCALFSLALSRQFKIVGEIRSACFWLIVAVGSCYLIADELFSFHEFRGTIISFLINQLKIPLGDYAVYTERFYLTHSDFILIFYGLITVLICWYFRAEFFKERRSIYYLYFGTAMLLASIVIDFNLLMKVHPNLDVHGANVSAMTAFEETFKTIGVAAIMSGIWSRYLVLKRELAEHKAMTPL